MERLKRVAPADMPEVLRLATELYARDQTQIARDQEREQIAAAAAEAGLPPEYLERAAAELEARRHLTIRPRRRPRMLLAAAGLALVLLAGLGRMQQPSLSPAVESTAVEQPAPPPVPDAPAVASYPGGNLSGASLPAANLAGQNLAHANMMGANLAGADLHGANLSHANLKGANLASANLTHANLWHANLLGANLLGATLTHANLTYADLKGADLAKADLSSGTLAHANLFGANLQGANLTGTTITRANLHGANLTGAIYNRPPSEDTSAPQPQGQ